MANKTYTVYWTESAQGDLHSLVDHISIDSVAIAKKIYKSIKEKASSLEASPLRGRIVPELQYYGVLDYRELVASPWRIIFRVDHDQVIVFAVIDSRRNVEDILLERLL